MKTNSGWLSPTEIGMKCGQYSKSNASAWAGRTLFKLVSGGFAERKQGEYKLTRSASKI